jgi:hypothetical protein
MVEKQTVRYAQITWGFERPATEFAELVQRAIRDSGRFGDAHAVVFGTLLSGLEAVPRALEFPGCYRASDDFAIPCALGSADFAAIFSLIWDNSFSTEMGAVVRAGAIDASYVARVGGAFTPLSRRETWRLPWDLSKEATGRLLALGHLLALKGHDAQWACLTPVAQQGELESALRDICGSVRLELEFRTVALPVPDSEQAGR